MQYQPRLTMSTFKMLVLLLVIIANAQSLDDDAAAQSFTHQLNGEDIIDEELAARENRGVHDMSGSGGSGRPMDPPSSCHYNIKASGFTSIATSLHDLADQCIEDYINVYNFTITGLSDFKTNTGDTKLLFADKFILGTSYTINVSVECNPSECDYPSFTFKADLVILNYTSRLLPYGEDLSDEQLKNVDDKTITIITNSRESIPVYNKRYKKLYMSSNGLVSFERPYVNWQAIPFPYGKDLLPILAPYWTDLDLRLPNLSPALYHNTYTTDDGDLRSLNILNIASTRIQNYYQNNSFEASWILISTWYRVTPYLEASHDSEECTFQLVLASNYSFTYALYLYEEDSFILQSHHHPTVVGHTGGDLSTYYTAKLSASEILMMDTVIGNTNKEGEWIFDLASNDKLMYDKCFKWINNQPSSTHWINELPSCPCTKLQAANDWKFTNSQSSSASCFILIAPPTTKHGLECCYDEDDNSLIVELQNGSSRYHYYHSLYYPTEHQVNDSDPYRYCCQESGNCDSFYRYRPPSNCSYYQSPKAGFMWGDPHFETLDGKNYTFNGIGEYQLLHSSTQELTVHVRLSKLEQTNATVLKAVAIKSYNAQRVQIELDTLGRHVIYIGNTLYSTEYGKYLVVSDSTVYDNDQLELVDSTDINNVFIWCGNESVIINTPSGASFYIGKQGDFLYLFTQLLPNFFNSTEGLMGVYDNDHTNDFQLPNGTVLLDSLSEEEVYNLFGLSWHVSESQSIFRYNNHESYLTHNQDTFSFTPSFGLSLLTNNSTLYNIAVSMCEEDYTCLYDTGATGSVLIGLATHEIRQFTIDIQSHLSNYPPTINGSRQIIINYNQVTVSSYTAMDGGIATQLYIKGSIPDGVQLNSTGHLILNLSSLPTTPLLISSTDAANATTTQVISILYCHCHNSGTCVNNASSISLNNNRHYQLICDCPDGYTGDYCEVDVTGCGSHDPCPTYTTCNETSSNYTCGGCDQGYFVNSEGKCIDFDECTSNGTNNCSQLCTNTDGGYRCACSQGYSGTSHCADVNECEENSDQCDHYCTNTQGGYYCTCDNGWSLGTDNHSCISSSPCSTDCLQSHFCSGVYCSCHDGYYYESTQCYECQSNSYGYQCNRTCSSCGNGGSCNSSTGCVCPQGWSGFDCSTEVNVYSPFFSTSTLNSISLPKTLPLAAPIMKVMASDLDVGTPGHVTYHLIESPFPLSSNTSDGTGVFSINETTGAIHLMANLSVEPFTSYLLHIQAVDGGHVPNKNTHLVVVEITNQSLPTPFIEAHPSIIKISENKMANSAVFTVNCTENDAFNQDITDLTVSIVDGNINNTFRMNGDQLVTNKPIDYEQFQMFRLTFSCTNAFGLSYNSTEDIVISNLDDNHFIFSSSSYRAELYENASVGDRVLTVNAYDADITDGIVSYHLQHNLFNINVTTGLITVDSLNLYPFDREVKDSYTFEVEATLNSSNSILEGTVKANVTVSLLDVNEPPTFISPLYISSNLSQSNTFPDTVLFVHAIDRDLGLNGNFNYSIQNNSNQYSNRSNSNRSHFEINEVTGEIHVATTNINRGDYTLIVTASDYGSPSLTGSTVVMINVKPTYEEIRFLQNKYNFEFPENSGIGTSVGKVVAKVYDIFNASIEEEDIVSYDIVNGSDTFRVDSNGDITLERVLDYEAESLYIISVQAQLPDFATVSIATVLVQLTLVDVNDNHPVFNPSMYSKLIYEDAPVGTGILTVTATDRDENGLQSLTYNISNDFDGPFSINHTGGVISVSEKIQSPADYHFFVVAYDNGQPTLSSEALVYISISRRSTIHPVLNSTLYIFDIPESFNSTEIIGTVGAITEGNRSVSPDDGMGFRLVQPDYGIMYRSPFVINSTTGSVTVDSTYSFDYETRDEYIMYVELYDETDPTTVFDTTPIIVRIIDENDNSPEFSRVFYQAAIPLSTPSGSFVLQVEASDDDTGSNGEIVYYINNPLSGFHINELSGVIYTTNTTLVPGNYHMQITASDKGHPNRTNTVDVNIKVLPSLSDIILFSQPNYTFTVMEDTPSPMLVGKVTINQIVNQTFTADDVVFSLKDPSSCFNVNLTGFIHLSCSSLNREKQSIYELVVMVTGPNNVKAFVNVQIVVLDINDNRPEFNRHIYTTFIYDDQNETSVGIRPIVKDKDEGINALSNFTTVSAGNLFTINSTSGEIFVQLSNNGTLLPLGDYQFNVTARNINSSLDDIDTATVLVSIVPRAPKVLAFSLSSLSFAVPENSPGGTFVGTLHLVTPLLINPSDYVGNLNFKILSGQGSDYFYISNSNGAIHSVGNSLDREVAKSHVLLIEASFINYQVSASAYVTINILDMNDNYPEFNQTLYVSAIDNTSPIRTHVVTVHATDADVGSNGQVSYHISNDSQVYFKIDTNTGEVTTVSSPIPEDHYRLDVRAEDKGTPSLTSTSVISITVQIPIPNFISFTQSTYTFHVSENSPSGTYLGAVGISQNVAGILYSFNTPSDDVLASNLIDFHLDPNSGNLTTLALIDREAFNGGTVTVTASLPSIPSLVATASVTIIIDDVNDNRPVFNQPIYITSITDDNINTNTILLSAIASDDDYGNNGSVTYQITGSNFNINSMTGAITAASASLTTGEYHLTVTATDNGSPQQSATVSVIITVYVAVPTFIENSYTTDVSEDSPVGTNCGNLSLAFIDTSNIIIIQYTVNSNQFTIPSTQPVKSLKTKVLSAITFDYETKSSYQLTVRATIRYAGSDSIANVPLTVRILDVNDNSPAFVVPQSGYYSGSVAENTPPGNTILSINSVTDGDSGTNSVITFSLQDNHQNRFDIQTVGNNAIIKTGITSIDREDDAEKFVLVVVATDGGSPSLSSTANVLINITDVNDNAPDIAPPLTYYVDEEQNPNVVLFTILGIDPDVSSHLKYSIISGSSVFNINNNGEVTSSIRLDYDQGPSQYILDIRVTDGVHTVDKEITVNLNDLPNDHYPIFNNLYCPIELSPYLPIGSQVTQITAADIDGDSLVYTMTSSKFTIDANNGVIRSTTTLNEEDTILLTITATDDSKYSLSTSIQCTVHILRRFDFNQTSYIFNVNENNTVGGIAGSVAINDPSLTLQTNFILDENVKNEFLLIKRTNLVDITMLRKIDYEISTDRQFNFKINTSTDGYLETTTRVTININDINDNDPTFIDINREISLPNSLSVNQIITKINATDADSGTNSIITYVLTSEDSPFSIERNTGRIKVSEPLTANEYILTIRISDSGNPPRANVAEYNLNVYEATAISNDGPILVVIIIIVSIVTILLIITVAILIVLLVTRRRKQEEKKNRDPYLDAVNEGNWQLKSDDKKGSSNSKKRKRKLQEFEMKRQGSDQNTSSAYETMYEDDLMELQQMPWANPSYRDTEDEYRPSETETDDDGSELTASASWMQSIGSEQKITKDVSVPVSRRGRRASAEDSSSDLDNTDYLKGFQKTTPTKPAERPIEYEIFLKDNSNSQQLRGSRPRLDDILWSEDQTQLNPMTKKLNSRKR